MSEVSPRKCPWLKILLGGVALGVLVLSAVDNVMSLIRRIRKKIEPDPSKPIYVLTVWGIGYKFNNAIKRK